MYLISKYSSSQYWAHNVVLGYLVPGHDIDCTWSKSKVLSKFKNFVEWTMVIPIVFVWGIKRFGEEDTLEEGGKVVFWGELQVTSWPLWLGQASLMG